MYQSFLEKFKIASVMSYEEVKVAIKHRDSYAQIKHWCKIEFGNERTISRSGRWWVGGDNGTSLTFRFINEIDATAFKLTWI